jgi:hypothetical protein
LAATAIVRRDVRLHAAGGKIADADVADLPALLELGQDLESAPDFRRIIDDRRVLGEVLDRVRMDRPVQHVEVDVIGIQALERGFAMFLENPRVAVGRRDFRADDDFVAPQALHGDRQRTLAAALVVRFGRVEVIDAAVDGRMDDVVDIALVLIAPVLPAAESPAADAEYREFQIRRAALPVAHIDAHLTTPMVSRMLAKRRLSPVAITRQVASDFASS